MKRYLLLLFFSIVILKGYAYDFSAVCSTGQTLYYNHTGNSTVEVTYPCNNNTYLYFGFIEPSGYLIIPDSVIFGGITYRVTSIGSDAFYNCSDINRLVIPNSVTSIGPSAFYGCSGIDTLLIGSGVTSIGNLAFSGCTGLKYMHYNACNMTRANFMNTNLSYSPFYNTTTNNFRTLVIGDSVRVIPDSCFYGRSSIDSTVVIPDSVTSIGSSAFYGCSGVDTLVIGSGVTTIPQSVFFGCSSIHRLVIPNSVTSIGQSAFSGCSGIDTLVIGSGVTSIGSYAFSGCSGLTTVNFNATNCTTMGSSSSLVFNGCTNLATLNIGANVTQIPNYAFKDCSGLTSVTIPNSVTSIGSSAFYGCSGVDTLVIGSGVTTIPQSVFFGCSSIHRLVIPNSVTNIGQSAFSGCSGIDTLVIGSGVTSIGSYAFSGCSGLTTVNFNATNCTTMGSSSSLVFNGCTNLATLNIGANVTQIPNYAFKDCSGLTSVTIPNSVTSIGSSAFYGCSGVDSLYLNGGIQSIGAGAFTGCTGLKYMYYNARNFGNALFASESNAPFANTATNQFATLVIGDSVEVLPSNAFRNRTSINTLNIGTGLTIIPDYAFYGCSGLNNLTLPNNITQIGNSAFYGCSGINAIVIPNSVTSIGSAAFRGCTSATSLSLGTGVTTIEANAFYGCTSIGSLIIPDSVTSIGNSAFQGCSNIGSLQIGSSITSITDNTFFGCSSIGSITIPNGVTSIGNSAFKGCTTANSLSLGTGVTHIGNNAFSECDNILTTNINAQYIGKEAFANCDRLVTVTLGDSVHTMSRGAFKGCFRLQSFTFGNGIDTIPSGVFSGCVRLENMQLSNGIRQIGDSAFYNCSLIHDNVLPEGLTSIGDYAFYGCSGISGMLEFPSTITTIGNNAFHSVGTVNRIRMNGTTPPTIYANTFYSVSNSTPVEVPCGAILNYYTTNYWENFSNIVEAPPFRLNVTSNNTVMGTATVTQQPTCTNHTALIQATANSGYHFLQWNDGVTVNPRTIPMSHDSSFTAIFVVNNSYIIVHANDSTMGSVSGTGLYGYNAPVTLTATAYSGYHFLKWNDGNTQNPRYLAAVRDSTFTAIFVSNVSTITVANANPSMGNVSGSGVYYYQNLVSITATPNYGYHFVQWQDGNTQNPRTITVSQDSAFTAYFALNTYSIVATSNSTTMGSVSGGGQYTYLHEMSMTATPAYGYHFVQWNDGVTDNPRTITVTRDSAFIAQFAANSYTLTVAPNDASMGSAYGAGSYNYNTTATLTAVANYGYHFTQWSDAVTDNPRIVTVLNNATYTAQFTINSYTITVQSSNPAIGTASGGGSYNYLTPVYITAIPNAGYHFTQWSDGNSSNPRLVSVTQNATYTAQFAINSYAVGVASNNSTMGSVSGSGTYNHNDTATLMATAYYGYHFVQWQDGNTQNPRHVVVTDSAQYTAQFGYNNYLITTLSNNISRGSTMGSGSYNFLSQVEITAVPMPHYHFSQWSDGNIDNPRTITVTQDSTFTAYFDINQFSLILDVNDSTLGYVSGSGIYNDMSQVTISAIAAPHCHFVQWNDGSTTNPRLVTVTCDSSFVAQFEEDARFTINVSSNDTTMGTVSGSGSYYGGEQVVLTATPNEHYHFLYWGDGNTQNPRTITIISDADYTAIFEIDMFTVTVTANDPTMGSVMGTGEYGYGTEITITAQPFAGYKFRSWSDGDINRVRAITVTTDAAYQAIFYNPVGIDDVETPDYIVSVRGTTIYINGVEQKKIVVYDILGHKIAYIDRSPEEFAANVPAAGVYLIQVEGMRTKKVVVY